MMATIGLRTRQRGNGCSAPKPTGGHNNAVGKLKVLCSTILCELWFPSFRAP